MKKEALHRTLFWKRLWTCRTTVWNEEWINKWAHQLHRKRVDLKQKTQLQASNISHKIRIRKINSVGRRPSLHTSTLCKICTKYEMNPSSQHEKQKSSRIHCYVSEPKFYSPPPSPLFTERIPSCVLITTIWRRLPHLVALLQETVWLLPTK
jgi:hypothetical protein